MSIDAVDLGIVRAAPDALRGHDAAFNAGVARAVISGERSVALDPVRDSVLLNAAAALVVHDVARGVAMVGSLSERMAAALPRAREAIDSGAAGALLERWITESSRLAGR